MNAPKKDKTDVSALILLILKAIALAMGVAVVVLSVMDGTDVSSALIMLGIGLACVSLAFLSEKKK